MATKKITENRGECTVCGRKIARAGMTRHLKSCLPAGAETPSGESLHLVVGTRGDKTYWMHVAIDEGTPLRVLDRFLRDTWLECCGHMSCFNIGAKSYASSSDGGGTGMGARIGALVVTGSVFTYEYDFGSTTELELKVVGIRKNAVPKNRVALLARNDPPEIVCQACGARPATIVCTECLWNGDAWFCDACADSHDCDEEMFLPVVNSPRVGVCAYTG